MYLLHKNLLAGVLSTKHAKRSITILLCVKRLDQVLISNHPNISYTHIYIDTNKNIIMILYKLQCASNSHHLMQVNNKEKVIWCPLLALCEGTKLVIDGFSAPKMAMWPDFYRGTRSYNHSIQLRGLIRFYFMMHRTVHWWKGLVHNYCLTHWPLDKMAPISQTIFLYAFSWMKHFIFCLNFT